MQEKSACREPRRRQRRASSASLRRRRRRANERRRRRARRRRAHVASDARRIHAVGERRETGARAALGAQREASSGFGDGRSGGSRRSRRRRNRRRAALFSCNGRKRTIPVTSVLLAAKNFSTRSCSEQATSDSSQERCGRWTDRTKEGQWIERPGTAPAARVVRLRL